MSDSGVAINDGTHVYGECTSNNQTVLTFTSYGPNLILAGAGLLNQHSGDFLGVPAVMIFIIAVAGLFTGRSANTGILVYQVEKKGEDAEGDSLGEDPDHPGGNDKPPNHQDGDGGHGGARRHLLYVSRAPTDPPAEPLLPPVVEDRLSYDEAGCEAKLRSLADGAVPRGAGSEPRAIDAALADALGIASADVTSLCQRLRERREELLEGAFSQLRQAAVATDLEVTEDALQRFLDYHPDTEVAFVQVELRHGTLVSEMRRRVRSVAEEAEAVRLGETLGELERSVRKMGPDWRVRSGKEC